MIKYTGVYFLDLHFMDHGFDRMRIQLIDKNGIVMMDIRLNDFIYCIAEKERFVVKVNLDKHFETGGFISERRVIYALSSLYD